MDTTIFAFIIMLYPCSIYVTIWRGPGTHKGPSTPHHHPVPLHVIRPLAPPVWPAAPSPGVVLRHVVARGGWVDVGGPCGCQASPRAAGCTAPKNCRGACLPPTRTHPPHTTTRCHYMSYDPSPRPCGPPRRRLGWSFDM